MREHDQHLRTAPERALDGFYVVDAEGRLVEVNDAYCSMSGYTREELLRMRVADLESAESEHDVVAHMQRIIRQGTDRFETSHRRKDGQIINIETSVSFQDLDGGQFFCSLRDITEKRRAERALRESEEHFRLLVEGAPLGIAIQVDAIYRYVNPAALAMFGAETADQIVGHAVAERIHPDNRAAVGERIRALKDGRSTVPVLEEQLFRLDGTVFDAEVNAKRFIFEGQEGSIVFFRDITDRKRTEKEKQKLQDQLVLAQKMESIGRLAGGVAHDFNNLLTVIMGYSQILTQGLAPGSKLYDATAQIRSAGERAAGIISQLLAFSRKQVLSPQVIDLNEVMLNLDSMLRRLIGEDIEVLTVPARDLGTVKADPGQIEQVLMNLALNARDAMPNGGKLTLETSNTQLDEAYAREHQPAEPGRYVMLAVSDTGIGMSPETQAQIFEPFYTTKELGKGTGLGLSTVYGIVKQSGGYIWVYSEPGRGSTFKVYFPRMDQPAEKLGSKKVSSPAQRGNETILLVEDDAQLRELASDILGHCGYKVLIAGNTGEALALCKANDREIALLVTDVIMPGMNGRQLAEQVAHISPQAKVLYISGYTSNAIVHHGVLDAGIWFLPKPFTLAALVAKVREVLDAVPDRSEDTRTE
ncbi:MAG: PAS domain S-box protein [Terriglobales bacterium]